MKDTSWKNVSDWYDTIVGQKGHYYHQELIFPKLLKLLSMNEDSSVLDLGCGQGVFSRILPEKASYCGIDFARPLIQQAKEYEKRASSQKRGARVFLHHDLTTTPWPLKDSFTHIVSILALQNMKDPQIVLREADRFLQPSGTMAIVLNHPCFRIPRQSRWAFDEATKTQTRELFSYMSPQEIPIAMHPGKKQSDQETTWSYHLSISSWSKIFHEAGYTIDLIDEWVSPKSSEGGASRWENRARKEFPLFLLFMLRKKNL